MTTYGEQFGIRITLDTMFGEVCQALGADVDEGRIREEIGTILEKEVSKELIDRFLDGDVSFCAGCKAVCCTMSTPIVLSWSDVQRMAKGFKTSNKKAIKQYLDLYVVPGYVPRYTIRKTQPCQWLNLEDARCTIYEHRPNVCRTYPIIRNENELTVDSPIFCSVLFNMMKQDIISRLS